MYFQIRKKFFLTERIKILGESYWHTLQISRNLSKSLEMSRNVWKCQGKGVGSRKIETILRTFTLGAEKIEKNFWDN